MFNFISEWYYNLMSPTLDAVEKAKLKTQERLKRKFNKDVHRCGRLIFGELRRGEVHLEVVWYRLSGTNYLFEYFENKDFWDSVNATLSLYGWVATFSFEHLMPRSNTPHKIKVDLREASK